MKIKLGFILFIVFALLLSACGTAANNNGNVPEAAASTLPSGAAGSPTETPGALIDLSSEDGGSAADLKSKPQAVEASTLARNILNTEVAGQNGRIAQVLGLVMNAASWQARYLVVRTVGLDVERTVLLPMGAYQVSLLSSAQTAETANFMPVVLLTAADGDLAAAPEIDPGIFTSTEQLIAGWDAEASQYWAGRVDELPVTGESNADRSQNELLYLSGNLLENFNIPVQDLQGAELGEIVDFVVDPRGTVTFAALNVRAMEDPVDTPLVVAASELIWDANQQVFMTSISEEQLRDAPRFNRSELPDMTIPGWDRSWGEYWSQQRDRNQTTPATGAGRQVKISQLLGLSVLDVQEAVLGEVEDMILDQNGSIQYLVVRAGSQLRPVPWMGFNFDFRQGTLTYLDDSTRFEEAPGFANMDAIETTNPEWDQQIRAYWGQSR